MADTTTTTSVNGASNGGKKSISAERTATNGATLSSASSRYSATDNVLYSDIGINVLLAKLKQSIASARDFASFLQRRSSLEESHASGLRKLARATNEATSRLEARQGTYAQNLNSVTQLHERMADNGMLYAQSLHQMHEDLHDLATNMERGRKHWKQEGLNNEKRVKDAELAMEKAKGRYENSADNYDRARTGDSSGRTFGIKGPKSAEQREEDLLRKAQTADQDYKSRVEAAQLARKENHDTHRPQAIKQLQELIRECDAALVTQLQRFATSNERLLVGNGMVVSPLQSLADGKLTSPSMKEMVQGIDNDRDFHMFVTSHSNQVPSKPGEVKYEKHSALGGAQSTSSPTSTRPRGASQTGSSSAPTSVPPTQPAPISKTTQSPTSVQPPSSSQIPPTSSTNDRQPTVPPINAGTAAPPSSSTSQASNSPSSMPSATTFQSGRQPSGPSDRSFRGPQPGSPGPMSGHPPSGSYSVMPPNTSSQKSTLTSPQSTQQPTPIYRPTNAPPTGPPGNAWNEARHNQSPVQPGPYQHPPRSASATNGPSSNMTPTSGTPHSAVTTSPPPGPLPAYNRVFGLNLDELFRRDDSPVPLVVSQCIQAVDLFGLSTEGIYRTSGNATHIAQLRSQFDHDSSKIDFRDPEAFHHDVNSVAGLLKMFFRDLPDPLFTAEHYREFIEAAQIDDPVTRRDSMHAVINALPDPNYATIRAMVLHLWRVQEHGEQNRMNVNALAICFAPTMMGGQVGLGQGRDTAAQTRVVQTVLENTFMIFDED